MECNLKSTLIIIVHSHVSQAEAVSTKRSTVIKFRMYCLFHIDINYLRFDLRNQTFLMRTAPAGSLLYHSFYRAALNPGSQK